MARDQAVALALKALYKGTDERFNEKSIEISYIEAGKFCNMPVEQVKQAILDTISNVKKGKK